MDTFAFKMANNCTQPFLIPSVSVYKSTRGHPKKFSRPWNSVMKRIYISEDSWMDFRKLKVTGKFSSDNDTLQFLLRKHKALEEQSLECDLSCSNSPVASASLPIAPVCCSTPTGMVSTNFMHKHLQKIFNDSIYTNAYMRWCRYTRTRVMSTHIHLKTCELT